MNEHRPLSPAEESARIAAFKPWPDFSGDGLPGPRIKPAPSRIPWTAEDLDKAPRPAMGGNSHGKAFTMAKLEEQAAKVAAAMGQSPRLTFEEAKRLMEWAMEEPLTIAQAKKPLETLACALMDLANELTTHLKEARAGHAEGWQPDDSFADYLENSDGLPEGLETDFLLYILSKIK